MFRCKQVSRALAEHNYQDLPLYRRLGMYLHIYLCPLCGAYQRQVVTLQNGVRRYLLFERDAPPPKDMCLSAEKKEEIRQSVRR